jgi:hypothetical protein
MRRCDMSIMTVIRIHVRTDQTQAQPAVLKAASLSLQSIGFRVTDLTLKATSPRIVAEDNGGRAFVVEAMPDGRFRAEVLGTADGSCVRIMREFVEGLRRQGIDVHVEEQRWTAGVPSTDTGRAWGRRRSAPTTAAPTGSRPGPRRKTRTIRIGG